MPDLRHIVHLFLLPVIVSAFGAGKAFAFPPYRSTDADTAAPYVLEMRGGLIKVERDRRETEILAPLIRTNLGLPGRFEIISEFEFLPEHGQFADGAAGVKWVPVFGKTWSFGTETLVLLPVRPDDNGIGVESQFLATYWREEFRLHMNAGGFHDARVMPAENGWRASLLAEFPHDRYRPGLELFAKRTGNRPTDVRAGIGGIIDMGSFDLRSGLHAGLSDEAPNISFSLWITTKLPIG